MNEILVFTAAFLTIIYGKTGAYKILFENLILTVKQKSSNKGNRRNCLRGAELGQKKRTPGFEQLI
jgi:hypothetical protein